MLILYLSITAKAEEMKQMEMENRKTLALNQRLTDAFFDALFEARPDIDAGCYSADRGHENFMVHALAYIVEELATYEFTGLDACFPAFAYNRYMKSEEMKEDIAEAVRLASIDYDGNWEKL